MRTSTLLLALASSALVFGCDKLKHGAEQGDAGAATPSATSTSAATNAANTANAQPTSEPAKPPQAGCDWPDSGDHDITIKKGCNVDAKNDLRLVNGVTMTIEEGAKIAFGTDAYLWVEYGKLIVKGTADAPVTFTSANKSPAAGDWVGIGFQEKTMAGTSLDHLIVEYAGSKSSNGVGGIQLEDMRQGGRISITNTIVRNSAQFGLVSGDNTMFGKFENNTFKDNKDGSVKAHAEVLGSFGRGNKFNQPIHVEGSIVDQSTTWPAFDVPVFVDDDIRIHNSSSVPKLTIADGTTVKMGQNVYISAGDDGPGAFVAKNVTFTSASPAPSPGDWATIFLYAKTNGTDIEGCTFEYFGSSNSNAGGAITLWSTNAKDLTGVTIKGNTFRKGKQQAMHSDDGKCAPFDTQNKADGIPFCNKP